jgi:fructosamine-3-kinase
MTDVLRAPSLEVVNTLVSKIFPASINYSVTRVEDGVSTHVYRVAGGNDVLYLRILPEENASFAPEVRVHEVLRERGVKVPEVSYFEHLNEDLQRSVMVTTEIAGEYVGRCSTAQGIRQILIDAGRDLAIINSIHVSGFGWITRGQVEGTDLEAEHPSFRAFALEDLDSRLTTIEHFLRGREIATICGTIECCDSWINVDRAWLAHGDFDVTHIFQQDGRYTGIIDFGEIRGGDPFYDPGHFRLHDGETLPDRMLSSLLEGYRQVTPLPSDYEQRIAFSSLLIGVRWLARMIEKFPERSFQDHQAVRSIRRDLAVLSSGT